MDQNKPKKYKLNCPESKYGFGLISEKYEYEAGEEVLVIYNCVATDTSYSFKVDADDVKYEYGSDIRIKFIMPEHDVSIECSSRNVMMHRPEQAPNIGVMKAPVINSFMGINEMNNAMKKAAVQVKATDKFCRSCGTKFSGNEKFCRDCGTPRMIKSEDNSQKTDENSN